MNITLEMMKRLSSRTEIPLEEIQNTLDFLPKSIPNLKEAMLFFDTLKDDKQRAVFIAAMFFIFMV